MVKPQNGTPDDTTFVVHMVPESTTTIRVIGPGGYPSYRLGWGFEDTTGARCMAGATCRFLHALGYLATSGQNAGQPITGWSEPTGGYGALTAAGIAVAAGRHAEFKFTSLDADTRYEWRVECQEASGRWGLTRLGHGSVRTLPAAGSAVALRIIGDSDPHIFQALGRRQAARIADAIGVEGDTGLCLLSDADPTDGITGTAYFPRTGCDADADCAGLGTEICSCPGSNTIAESVEDCDVDGVLDYLESYERNLNSIRWLEQLSNTHDPHIVINLGDFDHRHGTGDQVTLGAGAVGPIRSDTDMPVNSYTDFDDPELVEPTCRGGANQGDHCVVDGDCPLSTCSIDEKNTQLGNNLGYLSVEEWAYHGYAQFGDDEMQVAKNRVAFSLNRYAPVLRHANFLLKLGNHENGALFGDDSCPASGHCAPPYPSGDAVCNLPDHDGVVGAARVDPTCGGLSPRSTSVANTERLNNPNDLYPSGLTHPTYATYDESGHHFYLMAGKACLVFLDEYIYTSGADVDGDIFATDTSFPDAECEGNGSPLSTCDGAASGYGAAMPSTPYEWKLGEQEAWLTDTVIPACAAAGAKTLVRFSHHGFGGIGLSTDYDYGRGTCPMPARTCQQAGVQMLADADDVTRLGGATSSIDAGDPIPCWGVSAAAHESPWCDWVEDGDSTNGSETCEAADFTDPPDPLMDETTIYDAVNTAIGAGDLDRALHNLGHDHISSWCTRHLPEQGYLNWGQSGDTLTAPWADQTDFWGYYDQDGNGLPDYQESQSIKDYIDLGLRTYNIDSTLNAASPLAGWNSKNIVVLTINADGTYLAQIINTIGHDACTGYNDAHCAARTEQDGQVLYRARETD